jgi:hypothetical protein
MKDRKKITCPWDVLNYCDALQADPETHPKNYWTNTSSNEAAKRFIQKSDQASAKREIEKLSAGEAKRKNKFFIFFLHSTKLCAIINSSLNI